MISRRLLGCIDSRLASSASSARQRALSRLTPRPRFASTSAAVSKHEAGKTVDGLKAVAVGVAAGVTAYLLLNGNNTLNADEKASRKKKKKTEKTSEEKPPISYAEVQQHNTKESLWVVIRGQVYDLTNFIGQHPGGQKPILQHAGKDATKIFDSIHAKGLLETMLTPEQHLGPVDPATMPKVDPQLTDDDIRVMIARKNMPPLAAMINLADIEDVARKVMTKTAWHYYRSDAEDGYSYRNNIIALRHYFFRPRVLRQVGTVDTTTTILGIKSPLPIFVSPAAMAGLGHPEGEKNITRGAGKQGIIQGVSANASCTMDEIAGARVAPDQTLFYQLYLLKDRDHSIKVLKNAEELGYKAVIFTVDAPILGRREFDMRAREIPKDEDAEALADKTKGGVSATIDAFFDVDIGWKDVEWVTKTTKLPVIVKGLQTVEDCVEAAKYPGVKGILLSNHGGRQADYAPAAIDTLYELRQKHPEVFDKVEVYVDGGFRRGTDVLKAICLGARACGFGRSFLYANGAYGERGVAKTIDILREELINAMQQVGLQNLSQASPDFVKYMDREIPPNRPSDLSQD